MTDTSDNVVRSSKTSRFRIDFGYGRYYFEANDTGEWVRYDDIEHLLGPGNPTQLVLDTATKPLDAEIERLTDERDSWKALASRREVSEAQAWSKYRELKANAPETPEQPTPHGVVYDSKELSDGEAGAIFMETGIPKLIVDGVKIGPEHWFDYARAVARYVRSTPETRAVQVAGDRLPTTLAQFEQRASVLLDEQQSRASPCNALISFICDAVRLARENERLATTPLKANVHCTCGIGDNPKPPRAHIPECALNGAV